MSANNEYVLKLLLVAILKVKLIGHTLSTLSRRPLQKRARPITYPLRNFTPEIVLRLESSGCLVNASIEDSIRCSSLLFGIDTTAKHSERGFYVLRCNAVVSCGERRRLIAIVCHTYNVSRGEVQLAEPNCNILWTPVG